MVLAQGDAWQSAVQNLAPHSPVLVLSPNESSTELQQALLAGARGYAPHDQPRHRITTDWPNLVKRVYCGCRSIFLTKLLVTPIKPGLKKQRF